MIYRKLLREEQANVLNKITSWIAKTWLRKSIGKNCWITPFINLEYRSVILTLSEFCPGERVQVLLLASEVKSRKETETNRTFPSYRLHYMQEHVLFLPGCHPMFFPLTFEPERNQVELLRCRLHTLITGLRPNS